MLEGADESRRALELLDREEPEGVPHQDGDTVALGAPREPSVCDCEGDQTEIRLRLATAGREPEEIENLAIRVAAVDDAVEVQEDEGDLERPPRVVVAELRSAIWAAGRGPRRARPLLQH